MNTDELLRRERPQIAREWRAARKHWPTEPLEHLAVWVDVPLIGRPRVVGCSQSALYAYLLDRPGLLGDVERTLFDPPIAGDLRILVTRLGRGECVFRSREWLSTLN